MALIIPYMASARWYAQWLSARLLGLPMAGTCRGHINRTIVAGAALRGVLRLTLPVEGSAATTKRVDPRLWSVSEHGCWRRTHLGALDAAYGSTPFYHHLRPAIAECLDSSERGAGSVVGLTWRLHLIALEAMQIESLLPEMRRMMRERRDFLRELCLERREQCVAYTDEKSIFDVIFQKGPEASLAILDDSAIFDDTTSGEI